jgi:hypothetical protein
LSYLLDYSSLGYQISTTFASLIFPLFFLQNASKVTSCWRGWKFQKLAWQMSVHMLHNSLPSSFPARFLATLSDWSDGEQLPPPGVRHRWASPFRPISGRKEWQRAMLRRGRRSMDGWWWLKRPRSSDRRKRQAFPCSSSRYGPVRLATVASMARSGSFPSTAPGAPASLYSTAAASGGAEAGKRCARAGGSAWSRYAHAGSSPPPLGRDDLYCPPRRRRALARRGGTGRPRRVASTREVVHEDVESGPSVYTRAVGWVYVRKELVFCQKCSPNYDFFYFIILPPYPLLKTYDC